MSFLGQAGCLPIFAFVVILNFVFWKGVNYVAKKNYKNMYWRRIGIFASYKVIIKTPMMRIYTEGYLDLVLAAILNAILLL